MAINVLKAINFLELNTLIIKRYCVRCMTIILIKLLYRRVFVLRVSQNAIKFSFGRMLFYSLHIHNTPMNEKKIKWKGRLTTLDLYKRLSFFGVTHAKL